jgi:hypothetical protein
MSDQLEWECLGEPGDITEWRAITDRWLYVVFFACDEAGKIDFVARRDSQNGMLYMSHIGDSEQRFPTLYEAKEAVHQWHLDRYQDNEPEFEACGGRDIPHEEFDS